MEERGAAGMAYVGGLGNVAKVLLLLLNMAFMVAGCLLVYFSHRVKSSGWLDVFQGDYAWIGTSTLIFTLVVGAVVIALSALGCFGALLQQKLLLTVYGVVLVLTAALFVVVAIGAHMANSKAEDWGSQDYPATANEASLGVNFNELYCYAQVPYYCQDAKVNTVLEMFNVSLSGYFSDSTSNFTNVCATVTLAAIDDICAVCDLVAKYDEYSVVLDWTEASCPRTSANQIWCGGFLLNATAADDMSTSAPFMECRSVFYELVEKWTNVVMVASIICVIAACVVLAMTGVLWKNVRAARLEKPLPPAPAPMYQYGGGQQNAGLSQHSEAQTNSNNFSMHSNAPYNPNAAHRRYDSPY
ncbi:MORN repeat-containing protein 5 [Phytophthora cinnamomi]|uniref:MORN repeat-containing protein 5 n=1 Tax=Phytophthora cinnamomi TaxID=4785 RepID=UPI00355A116B|nr:MORN repeat-containing protein 5 [Phytophthora cinnamomi]